MNSWVSRVMRLLLRSMSIKNSLKKFGKGFGYAFSGLWRCIRTQRNMRFHIGAAGAVAALAVICSVSRSEALALMLTVGGVLALETVNTAIEYTVDLACKGERSEKAGAAKDCAAGAVLVFCFGAVGVACAVFLTRINEIFAYFADKPAAVIAAAVYAALWFCWVFVCFNGEK